jgi:hypothetical protein
MVNKYSNLKRSQLYQKVKKYLLAGLLKWTQKGASKSYYLGKLVGHKNQQAQAKTQAQQNTLNELKQKVQQQGQELKQKNQMLQQMIFDNVLSKVQDSDYQMMLDTHKFEHVRDAKFQLDLKKLKSDHLQLEDKSNLHRTPLGDYYYIDAKVQLTNEMLGVTYWKTGMFLILKADCVRNNQFDEELVKNFIRRIYRDYAITIHQVDISKHYPVQPKNLADIPFKQIKITSSTIEKINGHPEQSFDDSLCGLHYIYNIVVNQTYFKHISFDDLKQQFIDLGIQITYGISVNDIIKWIKAYYPNIFSLCALDPFYKCFISYQAPERALYILAFSLNHGHLYGITNHDVKKYISLAKRVDLNMVDYEYSYKANTYEYIQPNSTNTQVDEKYMKLIKGENLESDVYLVDDVLQVAKDVVIQTKFEICHTKVTNNSQLISFVHPISGKIIEQSTNYSIRRTMCETLSQLYPLHNFEFKNQSFPTLARSYAIMKFGNLPMKSSYTDEQIKFYDQFPIGPSVRTLIKDFDPTKSNFSCIDMKRCYSTCMRDMNENYLGFCEFDEIVPFTEDMKIGKGHYWIDSHVVPQLGGFLIEKGYCDHRYLRKLVKNNYLPKNKIKFYRKASFEIDHEPYNQFVKDMNEIFPDDKYPAYAKNLVNCFIGEHGTKYQYFNKMFCTTEFDIVLAMFGKYIEQQESVEIKDKFFRLHKLGDIHFCTETKKERLYKDNCPIFAQIVCDAKIRLIELIEQFYVPNQSKLIGYNTDCIYIENPKPFYSIPQFPNGILFDDSKYKIDAESKPKHYHEYVEPEGDTTITPMKEWISLPDIQFNKASIAIDILDKHIRRLTLKKLNQTITDIQLIKLNNLITRRKSYLDELKKTSMCVVGKPGCQKTTLICALYTDDCLILAHTNAVVERIRSELLKKGIANPNVHTFDSEFWKTEDSREQIKKITRICVDEFSMMPLKWFQKIFRYKKDHKCIIQLFGDPNQTKAIDVRFFNYIEKKAFRELCDYNLMTKLYFKEGARYSPRLNEVLEYFLKNQRLLTSLKNKTSKVKGVLNCITKHNNHRNLRMNLLEAQTKILAKTHTMVNKYFYLGQRVICNVNYKPKQMFNSKIYRIISFNELNQMSLCDDLDEKNLPLIRKKGIIWFNTKDFDPASVITCYRAQGQTFKDPYKVLQLNQMSFRKAYTSLSRGRRLDSIHFDYTDKIFEFEQESPYPTLLHFKKLNEGIIYEMHNPKLNVYYVGMTTNTIEKRFQEHKDFPKDPMHAHGKNEDWQIKMIIKACYVKESDLKKIETQYINQYVQEGKKLINKLKLPKAQVKYEMSAPNPIEFKEFTKYHIIECNGYFKLQYTEKGKQIEKIARCKRQSKEQALNSLKEKAPDKHMFDIAMKKYTQKTSEEQLVSVPSKKIIGKNSNQIPFVIPYPMPTPTETRIINRFRAIKEKEKQSKPKPDVAIPKIRQLPRKVIETDYSWMYQLDNVILCQ